MPFDVLVFVKRLGNKTPSVLGNLSVRSLGAGSAGRRRPCARRGCVFSCRGRWADAQGPRVQDPGPGAELCPASARTDFESLGELPAKPELWTTCFKACERPVGGRGEEVRVTLKTKGTFKWKYRGAKNPDLCLGKCQRFIAQAEQVIGTQRRSRGNTASPLSSLFCEENFIL